MPDRRVTRGGRPTGFLATVRERLRRLTAVGLPAAVTLGVALPLVHLVPVGQAARPPFLCQGWRSCDARGYTSYHYAAHQWHMYWRMFPGNNCTNYAAFVEATVYHVRRPSFLLGNGGQWAATAAAHGVTVNNRPSVGAVAEWDAGASGIGGVGHVGIVEEVGPHANYIVISQQDMTGMRDGYDWIQIKARNPANLWPDWPSHFIHFRIPQRADVGYFNTRYDTVSLRYSQTRGPVNYSGRLPGPPGSSVRPLVGDWRGTGADGFGFYDPKYGRFHLLAARRTRHGLVDAEFTFGPPGMIPLAGDWTGTGRDGIGYYNPKTGVFALRRLLSAGAPWKTFRFGPPHMIPLVGNWTGGRRDEVGFYNPAKGTFTLEGIIGSARVYRSFGFGPARMVPVAGNWDVGANEGIGYYDPRTGAFYLRVPLSRGLASEIIRFGQPHMIPLTGDWFGGDRRA